MTRISCFIFLVFCLLPLQLFASEFSPVSNKTLNGFEIVYKETAKGLGFTIIGESLLTGKKMKEMSRTQLNISSPVRKAFLIWSGETIEQNDIAKEIGFLTPGDKKYSVRAQRIWEKTSTGVLYSAIAEVTKHVTGSGSYGVKDLRSDPINPHGKDPYSVAGWALVVITIDPKIQTSNAIIVLSGLQVIKPGEIYEFPIDKAPPPGSWNPQLVGLIGGHGRAGNGSGNLLNGHSLSGGDDWDGSSGKFWDIDLFTVKRHNSMGKQGLTTITIDPLLQWLYPVGAIVKLESKK